MYKFQDIREGDEFIAQGKAAVRYRVISWEEPKCVVKRLSDGVDLKMKAANVLKVIETLYPVTTLHPATPKKEGS